MDLKLVGIKKVPGGSVTDSFLVPGVGFKKTFAYAGAEQQPKAFDNPKIVLLNVELELKSERANAEVRISDPKQYQSIVDAEWSIIYNKLDQIVKSGAKIVLSKLPIGDLATQYFADRDIFCAGRVQEEDLERVSSATGGVVQTSLSDLSVDVLGFCKQFEERQIGADRYNLFTGCPKARTATIILRGGAEQFIAETERSLHDAIMIVKRAISHRSVVGGGGAIEMALSRHLRELALSIKSKLQLVISAYAKALEVIPRQVAANAGFDATDIVNDLRAKHAQGNCWFGVDIENEGVCDTLKAFVWEPTLVKSNALSGATEAACLILSVDQTVKNPKAVDPQDKAPAPRGGMH
jgi:T-complex protein 1 subunit eta